jgi:LacI family transcriptional regulator
MVTTNDIAKEIGVSRQAVAAALKDDPGSVRVSAATRQRVREAAERMGYDPSQQIAARRLIGQRYGKRVLNHRIALFFPSNFHEITYFTRVLQGIMQMTGEHGFDLVTTFVLDSSQGTLPPSMLRGEIDAAIMFALPQQHQELLLRFGESVHFEDKPVVSLMHPLPHCNVVRADERYGAYQSALHLLKLGHRHLLYCYGDQTEDFHARERITGYKEALREYGLEPAAHLYNTWFFWAEYSGEITRCSELLLAKLDENPQITAILTINDQSAFALTALLKQSGRTVPADISVIGFDDTRPLHDAYQDNILTTVRLPLEEIGREAVRLILERIHEPELPVGNTVTERVLPVEFVIRRSTTQLSE